MNPAPSMNLRDNRNKIDKGRDKIKILNPAPFKHSKKITKYLNKEKVLDE